MFLLLLSLIFIYLFYLFFWNDYLVESFEGNVGCVEPFEGQDVQILSKDSLIDLLVVNPPDNYYDFLTELDFKARGVGSLDEYLQKIRHRCLQSPDGSDSEIIRQCIRQCNGHFADVSGKWIDAKKFRALPWKIAITCGGSTYEYGLPHTRGDVIIVNKKDIKNSDDFVDTLLHERVHVYQKMYPLDFQKYLDSEGFVRYCKRKDVVNVAANPDADEWVYMKDGDVFVGQYAGSGANYKSVRFRPVNHPRYDCPQEYSVKGT